jgi:hypothetical protein
VDDVEVQRPDDGSPAAERRIATDGMPRREAAPVSSISCNERTIKWASEK